MLLLPASRLPTLLRKILFQRGAKNSKLEKAVPGLQVDDPGLLLRPDAGPEDRGLFRPSLGLLDGRRVGRPHAVHFPSQIANFGAVLRIVRLDLVFLGLDLRLQVVCTFKNVVKSRLKVRYLMNWRFYKSDMGYIRPFF